MYVISSSSVQLIATHVLVMTHPKDSHSPMVGGALNEIKCDASQVIRVGEHMLTSHRLNYFDTVIIPAVNDTLWLDMLGKLKHGYSDLLQRYACEKDKQLIVYGNSVLFLPKQVLKVPHTKPLRRSDVIHGNEGLGVLPFIVDVDYDHQRVNKEYIREMTRYTSMANIYLFTPGAYFSPNLGIRNGDVFQVTEAGVKKIREIVGAKNEEEQKLVNEKKIPPMKYIYKEDIPPEVVKQVEAAATKAVKDLHPKQ